MVGNRYILAYGAWAAQGYSKLMWLVAKFTLVFWSLFQINFPIHVIPFLIFKLKTFRKFGLIKLVVRLFTQMT